MGTIAEDTLVMVAKETVYGTKVEGSQTVPVETVSADNNYNLITRDDDKVGSEFGLNALGGKITRALAFTMKAYPGDELGLILQQAFGDATSTDVGAPAATAYQHIFDLLQANLVSNSLSLELFEAGINSDIYDGVVVTGINFTGANDGAVKIEVTCVAQGRTDGNALSSESFTITAEKPLRFFNAVVNYNGGVEKVNSWNVNVDFGLLGDNFKQSQEIEQPVPNGRPVVTASFERFFADRVERAIYEAGTTAAFSVVITSGDNIGASASPFSLALAMGAAQIDAPVTPSGDSGKMNESLALKCYPTTLAAPAADTPLRVTLTNGTAAYA